MARFDRQIATALRLIALNGEVIQWRRTVPIFSVDTPWVQQNELVTSYDVSMVFFPDDRANREFLALLSGTEVPKGNIIGLMGFDTRFSPTIKDTVLRGGIGYGVRTVDVIAPNGQAILYTIGFDL